MRIFTITQTRIGEAATLAEALAAPRQGYLWIACSRDEFAARQSEIQSALQKLCGMQLVDLHVSDLLNNFIPSHYDYTSQYDLLVFRRLAAGNGDNAAGADPWNNAPSAAGRRSCGASTPARSVLRCSIRCC